MIMQEPFLSIVGGGLIAAIITIAFNVYWDNKKQKASEDWEFRRYQANLVHHSTAGLMEAFFSAKSEMLYLTSHARNSFGYSYSFDGAGRPNSASTGRARINSGRVGTT